MKKFFTLFLTMLLISYVSYGQVVITEISYNPPESNTDSLEYIEIFNAGINHLNLKNYKFSKGVDFTFPDTILNSGKYLLIVKNARAFNTVYKINALDWSPANPIATGNTLSNSGEILEIIDATGNILTSFKYDKLAPWPAFADGTDGAGGSIELCKANAVPSNGANWKVSVNDLGFELNGKKVFGTPGASNSVSDCAAVPDFTVEVSSDIFTPKDITIDVGQTVRWVNKGGTHNVNGTQATFPNNPESFGNGAASSAAWTYDFKFTKEGKYDYQCDPHADFGMKGTVTVKAPVIVDIYPLRTIAQMTNTNSDGVADSLNVTCTLTGTVLGINFRPTGLQFTIVDQQNNGIGIFNNSGNLDYTLAEGDIVEVKGKLVQFRGLTQIELNSVKKISGGNPLVQPKVVTSFIENDESSLVIIKNVSFADPTQWTGTGSGFNLTMNDGTNDYLVRIINATDAYSQPLPGGTKFNVTGILTQFSSTTAPYVGGYQLQPRYYTDIASTSGSIDVALDANIRVQPNPSNHMLNVITESRPEKLELYNLQGQLLQQYKNTLTIDMSEYAPGMYLIKAVKGKQSSTVRIIKM